MKRPRGSPKHLQSITISPQESQVTTDSGEQANWLPRRYRSYIVSAKYKTNQEKLICSVSYYSDNYKNSIPSTSRMPAWGSKTNTRLPHSVVGPRFTCKLHAQITFSPENMLSSSKGSWLPWKDPEVNLPTWDLWEGRLSHLGWRNPRYGG